jgi:hypothetical protein
MEHSLLDSYRGRHHVLLLFAPSLRSPAYEKQMMLLNDELEALREHGVVVAQVFTEGESSIDRRPLTDAETERLRSECGVPADAGFHLVFVNRSGEEVRRDRAPVQMWTLYEAIGVKPPEDEPSARRRSS